MKRLEIYILLTTLDRSSAASDVYKRQIILFTLICIIARIWRTIGMKEIKKKEKQKGTDLSNKVWTI